MKDLYESFNELTDADWLQLWLEKAENKGGELASALPDFPPNDIQVEYVGSALSSAIREAYGFYAHAKQMFSTHGENPGNDDCFLDFGCGWGRYIRLFSKDYPSRSIFAADVNADIIDECRKRDLPGEFMHISPLGAFSLPDGKISSAMAYSVFTHLPEDVHLHWRTELARVTKPGAVLVITVQPRRFLRYIENRGREILGPKIFGNRIGLLRHFQLGKRRGSNAWHKLLAESADRVPEFAARYDNGELVFMEGTDGNKTYGDAIVPVSYIEKNWAPDFEVVDVIDDKSRFAQSVITLKRI